MPDLLVPAPNPEDGCRLTREEYRPDFRERDARIRGRDSGKLVRCRFHRVRVVERSLTGYLQGELHSLRMRAECGERVRIVLAEDPAEDFGPLPGIVVLGGRTLYQGRHPATGGPDGAIRWTDPERVGPWQEFIRSLYRQGEDVASRFVREVAPLVPPCADKE
ncbi:DUF6879 family protein [Kitasatospora sp. CB02891]|uniref:DUF6879 family protein n=1 Tax=Kitasatospora sp. CB02891 TaxID=2020329 RepID=UPI000C26F533|nr:DUF6879 family protein [Kitasatospora sp. CB02891]PJN22039.1 hypothetical protein CG736_29915 [Kitasatospora sp. CB02891]